MPRPDGTYTLEEYAALPNCPGCGNRLIDVSDGKGGCRHCAALDLPNKTKETDHIFGLLTGRIAPNPVVWEK